MVGAYETFPPHSIACGHMFIAFGSCFVVELDYSSEQNTIIHGEFSLCLYIYTGSAKKMYRPTHFYERKLYVV